MACDVAPNFLSWNYSTTYIAGCVALWADSLCTCDCSVYQVVIVLSISLFLSHPFSKQLKEMHLFLSCFILGRLDWKVSSIMITQAVIRWGSEGAILQWSKKDLSRKRHSWASQHSILQSVLELDVARFHGQECSWIAPPDILIAREQLLLLLLSRIGPLQKDILGDRSF